MAFKYAVIKLIDRNMTSGTAAQANIDMYPMQFQGIELPIFSDFSGDIDQKESKDSQITSSSKSNGGDYWQSKNVKDVVKQFKTLKTAISG